MVLQGYQPHVARAEGNSSQGEPSVGRSHVLCVGVWVMALLSAVPQEGWAQRPSVVSPKVKEDGSVTFSLYAPKAEKVTLVSGEIQAALASIKAMEKDDKGVWSVTLGPLEPGIYDYLFDVD